MAKCIIVAGGTCTCLSVNVLIIKGLIYYTGVAHHLPYKYQMERIGICHHMDRVSPVFDVAENLQVFEIENGRVERREERSLISRDIYARAKEVSGCGIDTIICGAISFPLEMALQGAGVRVLAFVRGPIDDVVRAFVEGRLDDTTFFMPGCRPRGGRLRGRRGRLRTHTRSMKGGPMKIAVTSTDGAMDGKVDERFGRCRKVIIYDPETKEVRIVDNSTNMGLAQGAGIQTAQNILNTGARAVISGHVGPKAFQALSAAGIEVYSAIGMTVNEALSQLQEGRLSKLAGADASSHW